MKIACMGGGPGCLYFSILMKKSRPDWDIHVYEREKSDVTFGFGVVFSDQTMGNIAEADAETYQVISERFIHWDNIDVHYQGRVLTSGGHGFAGMSRLGLLQVLQARAAGLGVNLHFEQEITDLSGFGDCDIILGGDGVNSMVRGLYEKEFETEIDWRKNKFVWLGTDMPLDAFTFMFAEDEHGLWRVHAYQFEDGVATFLVECREETWRSSGMDKASEEQTVAYVGKLFAKELGGHKLIKNKSVWRTFPTITNGRWHHKNIVLLGDAVHTAHWSVGSGTKLAMEDAITLRDAIVANEDTGRDVEAALDAYEEERRPPSESLQRAAQVSLEWFENTERYFGRLEPEQFAFSLLTRSLRVDHSNLRLRDGDFMDTVDAWFADSVAKETGIRLPASNTPPPPMFTPFKLRGMELVNRIVVSAMCQYSYEDGTVDDWTLVHLGSRAVGGAGLIMTEMTDISRDGRITPGCAGLYRPEHVAAWKRIVDFVHGHSAAKIGVQLAHAGRKGATKLAWDGMDEALDPSESWEILAASALPYTSANQVPREMTRADMDQVRDDFVRATQMSEEAGFDLVEVHFAHGYLLSTFLSPLTNQRRDEYGGSLENRLRFPLEVFDAVRAVWPANKPMSVRISATDWVPGGNTGDDAVAISKALKDRDCDIVDVSAGQVVADQEPKYGRLYQTPFAERVRYEANVPTMAVGNISSFTDVNSILAAGRADLCALARAHLYDPYWTRHAAYELDHDMPWPDPYASIQDYTPRFKDDGGV